MPRIRCPNCGTTIDLESRRELDYKMILNSVQKDSKTFTDLLKITGLPRKTLSMRLTALRDSGIIVKDGGYRLNGSAPLGKWGKIMESPESQLSKPSFFTRKNVLITLMLLVIAVPIGTSVLGMLTSYQPPPAPPPEPPYIGTFKMELKISDAKDLYIWQVTIHFNSSQLVVVEEEIAEGNFFTQTNPPHGTIFTFDVDKKRPGTFSLLGSLLGDVSGVNGSGTLAIVTFGYKSASYDLPRIVYDDVFETTLLDSNLQRTTGTLALELEG